MPMGTFPGDISYPRFELTDVPGLECTDATSDGLLAEALAEPCPPPDFRTLVFIGLSTEESPYVISNTYYNACLLGKLKERGRPQEAPSLAMRSG
eukprot:1109717-Pyramimonas_sp.AAC.1